MAIASKNFNNVDLGAFASFTNTEDAAKARKQFFKESSALTGMEISVTTIPAGGKASYFHSHKQNEELYIVVSGRGQIQLDGEVLEVSEGSLISVKPETKRALRAAEDTPLTFLCIQAKEASLEQYSAGDGIKNEDETWVTKC